MTEAYVGERHEFPAVCAAVDSHYREAMRTVKTTCLMQLTPRYIRNYSTTDGTNQTRRCSVCREVKPFDQFNRSKSNPFGREHACRQCRADMYAKRRARLSARAA